MFLLWQHLEYYLLIFKPLGPLATVTRPGALTTASPSSRPQADHNAAGLLPNVGFALPVSSLGNLTAQDIVTLRQEALDALRDVLTQIAKIDEVRCSLQRQ